MPLRDNEFSESPRGKKLARAYPLLGAIRQQERDKLYKQTSARPRPVRPSSKNNDYTRAFKPTAAQLAAMCNDDCDGCVKCQAIFSSIGNSNTVINMGYIRGSGNGFKNGFKEGFYTYGHMMKAIRAALPDFDDLPDDVENSRPPPTSTDAIKYPSNCAYCRGYKIYCYACSSTAGQRDMRQKSEIQKFKHIMNGAGMEIVTSAPSDNTTTKNNNKVQELEARVPSDIAKSKSKNNSKDIAARTPSEVTGSKNNTKTKDADTLSWTMAGPFPSATPPLPQVTANTRRAAEAPYACAQSFNGTPIWCVVDSGASSTKISPSFLKTAYPGIMIFDDRATFTGFNGGKSVSTGRIDLKMVWTGKDGRQVLTQGEAWVAPEGQLEEAGCHVLLGLPYMRDNGMNLTWSSVQRKTKTGSRLPQQLGDKLEIKGVTVEIFIAAR